MVILARGVKISKEQLDNAHKTKFSLCITNLIDGLFSSREMEEMSWSGRLPSDDDKLKHLTVEARIQLRSRRAIRTDTRIEAVKGISLKLPSSLDFFMLIKP